MLTFIYTFINTELYLLWAVCPKKLSLLSLHIANQNLDWNFQCGLRVLGIFHLLKFQFRCCILF